MQWMTDHFGCTPYLALMPPSSSHAAKSVLLVILGSLYNKWIPTIMNQPLFFNRCKRNSRITRTISQHNSPNRSIHTSTMKTFLCLVLALSILTKTAATPNCCDLSFDCINNNRASPGYYKIAASLSREERDICTRQGRANWCVARWTDNLWYCTSPGNFLEHRVRYAPQCPGKKWPPKKARASCCRAYGGVPKKCQAILL